MFATSVAIEKQQILHTLKMVLEALVIHHAMHILHTVICDLSVQLYYIFQHNLIKSTIFGGGRQRERERNVSFEYLYDFV